MNSRKHYLAEKLIVITFPVALFAGCAGSGDIKSISEAYTPIEPSHQEYLLTQNDLADISLAYTEQTDGAMEQNHAPVTQTLEDSSPYTPYAPVENNWPDPQVAMTTTEMETLDSDNTSPMDELNSVVISTENRLHFESDKYDINSGQQALIKQHADYLVANAHVILTINGHADIRGTQTYNQALSNHRAQAVFQQLVSLGVPPTQLVIQAHGEDRPLQNQNNLAENRRVEFEYGDAMVLSVAQ